MKPNIILITVDCWRGDHLGLAKNAKAKTPNIDQLAKHGTYFSNAYTTGGWTKVAMTSLLSSTYGSMHGFCQGKMSDERPLLAEELQKNNYRTAGFTTNLVCGKQQGFDRGFDTFGDLKPELFGKKFDLNKVRGFHRLSKHTLFHSCLSRLGIDSRPSYPSLSANQLVEHGLEWLNQEEKNGESQKQPYFLWLHFMDLHMPYRSSARARTPLESKQMWQDRSVWLNVKKTQGTHHAGTTRQERWQQLYAEETSYLDRALGNLFSELKKRDDWQETALCLTADHGEEFYEHGSWGHSWNQLHDEGVRVPLLIKSPTQAQAQTCDSAISHIDIAPTLLEFAGIKKPEKMLGESLKTRDDGLFHVDVNKTLYCEMLGHANSYRYRLSIINNKHKYIYDGDSDTCYLFDLDQDPKEQKNLYSKSHPLTKSFDTLRLKHISKGALEALKGNLELSEDTLYYDLDDDPAVIERLRALGYMD